MLHEVNFSRAAFDEILQQIINERECYIFGFYLLNCCECRLLKSRNFFHHKQVSSELWRSYVRANQFLFSYAKSIAFMISFQLKADTFQFYNKHDLLEILQMPRSLPNSKCLGISQDIQHSKIMPRYSLTNLLNADVILLSSPLAKRTTKYITIKKF